MISKISVQQFVLLFSLTFVAAVAKADGNRLLDSCQSLERAVDNSSASDADQLIKANFCLGLIQGVRNTMQILDGALEPQMRTCWPAEGISNGQATRIVLKFLRENPASLHRDETSLTISAFMSAYRCKRK
jgi:hypothetical protein